MHKSVFTFGFLLSSLVMLAVMPFVNMNNVSNALAQGYEEDNNYYGDSSSYSEYPTEIINMSVEQVHLKAFL